MTREYDKAVEAQTKATLDELSKRKRLFKLPDRTPVQPWKKDGVAVEPVYVPLYTRYPLSGGEGDPYSGSGLVKPEYRWLATMSGTHPTPKPCYCKWEGSGTYRSEEAMFVCGWKSINPSCRPKSFHTNRNPITVKRGGGRGKT